MARLRFGDQSVPRVTRVATGGGGGTIGGMSDVDLTCLLYTSDAADDA